VQNLSNRKIVEKGKVDIPNIHADDRSFSLLGTGTQNGRFKLVLWGKQFTSW
jgi:hypothetical protein